MLAKSCLELSVGLSVGLPVHVHACGAGSDVLAWVVHPICLIRIKYFYALVKESLVETWCQQYQYFLGLWLSYVH